MENHGNVVRINADGTIEYEDGTIDHYQCNGYIHWIDSPTIWEDSPTSREDNNGNTHYR